MSLINDALKRARQTPGPPPPDLQFRGVEPAVEGQPKGSRLPGIVLVVGLVLAGLLVWNLTRRHAGTVQASQAQLSAAQPQPASPAAGAETAIPVRARSPLTPAEPVAASQPSSAAPTAVATTAQPIPVRAQQAAPAANAEPTATSASASNVTAAIEPPAPALPPLKLQGAIYDPRRPSAVINGRTLFLGDRIRDFRVAAIRQDGVTLVGAGQTNVLTLAE